MTVRTCIICGGPTGSREHIFPAALGGRRTNKGIYCGDHNNAYSNLAGIITAQLAIFNALLGVTGDHADDSTSVMMTDVASGKEIELNSRRVRFKIPQIQSSEVTADGKIAMGMSFSSRKEAEDWAREQKTKGVEVKFVGEQRKGRYFLGTAHKRITLGGNEEGLRAIGYIAQTFFAHAFPEVARLAELQAIKDYTLKNVGGDFVWWDFDPPKDVPANKFPFGHRVIVGLNGEDGAAYARISFFSALNFAILLGTVPGKKSRAIITDIDPLAKSPPNDIVTWTEDTATGAVFKPDVLSASLAEAVRTGRAEAQIQALMRRITDFERQVAAAKIMRRVAGAADLTDIKRAALFADVVSAEAQRVFNLMSYVAKDLKRRASSPVEHALASFMEQAVELDPTTENGLTQNASQSLTLACEALAKQMSENCKAGTLDLDRIEMLIGGGPGAAVVGDALAQKFALRFPDR